MGKFHMLSVFNSFYAFCSLRLPMREFNILWDCYAGCGTFDSVYIVDFSEISCCEKISKKPFMRVTFFIKITSKGVASVLEMQLQ